MTAPSPTAEVVSPPAVSPLAPFRHRAFFWLWLGVVIASVGSWGQTVGAQWLFINDPHAATIVPLVQTASTLPMMLLALPAGVLADAFDRRWLLFAVQVYFVVVSVLLAVLTALGLMPPALLLAFTFAIGAGSAMLAPTWQSLISELVPRGELAAATRLDMVSVNVARAAGPALAGVVIAHAGVPPVFALNAAAVCVLAGVLLAWGRPTTSSNERERFIPALRAGGRYVRHEPAVRRILLRLAAFILPACAVWALLPLVANRQLGLGAGGYGLLFGALGLGAVAGALGLGRIRRHLSSNTVVIAACVAFAIAFAGLALTTRTWVAVPLLVVCGAGWTATVASVNSELQLFLPGWVRARALGIYLLVFLGTQAVGSLVWGLLTQSLGLQTALLAAAGLVGLGAVWGLLIRIPDSQHLDRSPAAYWVTPALAAQPDPDTGPVVVCVDYRVAAEQEAAFLAAMQDMRRSRLRSGANRWSLYRTGEAAEVFVEQFELPTWAEHQRQHDGRLTTEDAQIEQAAFAHVLETPRTRHLLPATTPRSAATAAAAAAANPGDVGSPQVNP